MLTQTQKHLYIAYRRAGFYADDALASARGGSRPAYTHPHAARVRLVRTAAGWVPGWLRREWAGDARAAWQACYRRARIGESATQCLC